MNVTTRSATTRTSSTQRTFAFAAALVALVACAGTASPAFAAPCDDRYGGSGHALISAYALPITALGGITLAEYVAAHHAGDARLNPVV